MQESAWQACLEFPPSETTAERQVSLTSPRRPCPQRHRQSIAPQSPSRVCQSAQNLQSLNPGHFQIVYQSGPGATVRGPRGHVWMASYLQIQSDRAAYAVKFRFTLPEVENSWRPSKPAPFLLHPPDSIQQQRFWCRGGSNRCSVGQQEHPSTNIPHRIDPSTWADAQFPPTRQAGPRHHCASSKTVILLIHQ